MMIDTNIAIYLRDAEPAIEQRVIDGLSKPVISILSQVELEGGVYRDAKNAAARRASLDALIRRIVVLAFDEQAVAAYSDIIAAKGYSRSKLVDQMIAATAIAHDLTFATINGNDFRDIPGLKLEIWPAPQ